MTVNRDNLAQFAQTEGLTVSQEAALVKFLGLQPDTLDNEETLVLSTESKDKEEAKENLDLQITDRYTLHDRIGAGGIGQIFRAWDSVLQRFVAVKVLNAKKQSDSRQQLSFLREARLSGRIQHANIVPIYELGRLTDHRIFYVMPEIIGRSLSEVLETKSWSLRRLVGILLQVVEAVHFTHGQLVTHLDLKPANIMIAENGSVYLVDWGLAKRVNEKGTLLDETNIIQGTPYYMAPEQAVGKYSNIGIKSDIYSLGSILYEIISGKPPYNGNTAKETIKDLLKHPPAPIGDLVNSDLEADSSLVSVEIPSVLVDLCEQAMVRDLQKRTITTEELRNRLQNWLDGVQQREKARLTIVKAAGIMEKSGLLQEIRAKLRVDLDEFRVFENAKPSLEEHFELFELNDRFERTKNDLGIAREKILQLLHSALNLHPGSTEARLGLLDHFQMLLEEAEAEKEKARIELHLFQMKSQLTHLPKNHPRVVETLRFLEQNVSWTLRTTPTGATVKVHRYVEKDYRLQESDCIETLTTPVTNHVLAKGSYRLHVSHPQCETAFLPLHLRSNPPSNSRQVGHNYELALLKKGTVKPDEKYVPAGFFIFGSGNKKINSPLPKDIWLDGYVAMLNPITQKQILEFFNDQVDSGREDLISNIVPRHYTVLEKYEAPFIYNRDSKGHFRITNEDVIGDTSVVLKDNHPAIGITFECGLAYADWLNKRQRLTTEEGWRIPTNKQWEKMARGVDGRLYTWGNRYTPQWGCTNASVSGKPTIETIDAYPTDESPYGIRSLSGCIREWTSTKRIKDQYHDVRGSSWFDPQRYADVTGRSFFEETGTYSNIGFRLVRPVPKSAKGD